MRSAIKKQMANGVTAGRRAVPGLAEAIEFREASTPLTNFRYTRNPRGVIEGCETLPGGSIALADQCA